MSIKYVNNVFIILILRDIVVKIDKYIFILDIHYLFIKIVFRNIHDDFWEHNVLERFTIHFQ